jgi:hypothetical protein
VLLKQGVLISPDFGLPRMDNNADGGVGSIGVVERSIEFSGQRNKGVAIRWPGKTTVVRT